MEEGDVTWHESHWDDDESRFLAFTLHDRSTLLELCYGRRSQTFAVRKDDHSVIVLQLLLIRIASQSVSPHMKALPCFAMQQVQHNPL